MILLFLRSSKQTFNVPLICRISTCPQHNGINKYTTPTREYILKNQEMERRLQLIKDSGYVESRPKKDIVFSNRNPRHMELMGFNKPGGFSTLYESRNFYNKLHLEITSKHTNAFVEHISGAILCYASTKEPYIADQLHNNTDVMAVVNVARVLSERCKQTGLLRVNWSTRLDRQTEKIREFEGTLINNGIVLSELAVRVQQGASETLPPPRPPRKIPAKMTRGVKLQGTVRRKDKKDFINTVCLDAM